MKKRFIISFLALVAFSLGAGVAVAAITNGDFESGYADFTSGYIYTPRLSNTSYSPPGIFDVNTDPQLGHPSWASYGAHSGSNMMIVNGADTANVNVWQSSTAVAQNTDYYFSAWVASAYPESPAVLKFSINGSPTSVPFTASTTTGLWQQFYAKWNSGSNATAILFLVNQNTAFSGNDFALDDIVLGTTRPTGGTDTTVPIPPAVLLLGTGLLGLIGIRRYRK